MGPLMERVNWNLPQHKNLFSFDILSQSTPLSTGNCQGVCFDGTHYYFTADNGFYKYTRSGDTYTLVLSRNCTGDEPTAKTQINEVVYKDGFLWAGANNFSTSPGASRKGWILKYDPLDLTLVDYFSTSDNWGEGGAWKDVGDGDDIWTVYSDTDFCSRYRNIGGIWTHIGNYDMSLIKGQTHIVGVRGLYQGCEWYEDYFIAVTHAINPDTQVHVYKWNGTKFVAVEYYSTPTPTAGQGISWEVYGSIMLFADRNKPDNIQTIVRCNFNVL